MSLWYMRLAQTNRVPDWLIRLVIRNSLTRMLKRRYQASLEERTNEKQALIKALSRKDSDGMVTETPGSQQLLLFTST